MDVSAEKILATSYEMKLKRWNISGVLDSLSFSKPQSTPPKKLFSQEMYLKIPLSSRGLKWSNLEPHPVVSASRVFTYL
jgi:hypothetical protein